MKFKSQKLYSKIIAAALLSGSVLAPIGHIEAATPSYITVKNNVGVADTVTFSGVVLKDTVKVYNSQGDKLLGSAVASKNGELTVSLKEQFTESTIKVSLTSSNKLESEKVVADVADEAVTEAPKADTIKVANNVGTADTVTVAGLAVKDIVKVYTEDGVTLLGTATAAKAGDVIVILKAQLDVEKVSVSVTNVNSKESSKTEAAVAAEVVTEAPVADTIKVANNVGTADTVTVTGLAVKDIVKVYTEDGVTLLGTATATKAGDVVVILKAQLDVEKVSVSVTNVNSKESSKTEAAVAAEVVTEAPVADTIKVANNVGTADTVTVTGLAVKDIVKVYTEDGVTLLGTATAAKAGDVVVILKAQLDAEKVSVSVTNENSKESSKTEAAVAAEVVTEAPVADTIKVANNVGTADTVTVTGLAVKDIVKVYTEDGVTLLGTATAAKAGDVVVILKAQLDAEKVSVSVTNVNSKESSKTEATVAAEVVTEAPVADTIKVANNVGTADTVTVTGLAAKDIVKVYTEDGVTLLGTATAAKAGDVVVILKAQLDVEKVSVSVTNVNSKESSKTEAAVAAEVVTEAPVADTIKVANNVGTADTVTVTGLAVKDVVKVYTEDGLTLLGTATATKAGDVVVILKAQLDVEKVSVSVTNENSKESSKTEAVVAAEVVTEAPVADTIKVANNVGTADTVTVTGLAVKDIVKVYTEDGVTLLGTATATKAGDVVVILKAQLDVEKVSVSVTNVNSKESSKTEAVVAAEVVTEAPVVDAIKVANNVGTADTVTVTGLAAKDIVKVYTEDGLTLLGTATATKAGDVVVILKAQLDAEKVSVSVTNVNSKESSKTEATVAAEVVTEAPVADTIKVANNVGIADTVTVTGLAVKDIVKVYTEDGLTLLGTATATKAGDVVVILKAQLDAEKVSVSVTNVNSKESSKTEAAVAAEVVTEAPVADTIKVANNVGIADTVTVTGLAVKDIVKVYTEDGLTLLGTATATKAGDVVVILKAQLLDAKKVSVSVTNVNSKESSKTEVVVMDEQVTELPK